MPRDSSKELGAEGERGTCIFSAGREKLNLAGDGDFGSSTATPYNSSHRCLCWDECAFFWFTLDYLPNKLT